MKTDNRIRPIAIGVILNNAKIFVFEGEDPFKAEIFYRPPGGAIEFGERGEDALRREFKEEIDADIINLNFIGTIENIFTYKGEQHHEIVLLYSSQFRDEMIYDKSELIGKEDDGSVLKCLWKPLADFAKGDPPLYPQGLLQFLLKNKAETKIS